MGAVDASIQLMYVIRVIIVIVVECELLLIIKICMFVCFISINYSIVLQNLNGTYSFMGIA